MRRASCLLVNVVSVFMPALSPSMETGTIVSWKKKVGDLVRENEVFCTVQTDKAVVDYTNTFEDGYIARILRGDGETVPVAEAIALMVDTADDISRLPDDPPAGGQSTTPAGGQSTTPASGQSTTPASGQSTTPAGGQSTTPANDALAASGPAVARIAARLDRATLSTIRPSGKNGRFLKGDFVGQPGFDYDEATPPPPAPPTAPPTAGVALRAFPVHNFKVRDGALLQHFIRTMPPPKKRGKV